LGLQGFQGSALLLLPEDHQTITSHWCRRRRLQLRSLLER